ncbi:MAG: recombinase family protein [Anaeroplasma sp.]
MTSKESLVAIYCRLSSDDGMDSMSVSIENQMNICNQYLNDNGLTLYNVYIDDGYSGANFDRPGFQNMINDLEMKRFGCIIVKDLSRLGRNFLKVSYYVEDYFVAKRIRFISIQDNYDSFSADTEELEITIKNFLNSYYIKECSKKMRAGYKNKAKNGTLSVKGHYGFLVEGGRYIPDPVTAPIVKEIFKRFISGERVVEICNYLKENKVLTPSYYLKSRIENNKRLLTKSGMYNWQTHSVYVILKDEQYTGTLINFKYSTHKYGAKLNKRDKSKWQKQEEMHEGIISYEDFEKAQIRLQNNFTKNKKINHIDREVLGLKRMVYTNTGKIMCFGGTFSKDGKLFKSTFYSNYYDKIYVKSRVVHEVVYNDLVKTIKMISGNKDRFIEIMKKKQSKKNNENEIIRFQKRIKEIDVEFQLLFEKLIAEEIDDNKYELENEILNNELKSLNKKINDLVIEKKLFENKMKKIYHFVETVNQVKDEKDKLETIRKLVSKIIVSKNEERLHFKIVYNFEY